MTGTSKCDEVRALLDSVEEWRAETEIDADALRRVQSSAGEAFVPCVRDLLRKGTAKEKRFAAVVFARTPSEEWSYEDLLAVAKLESTSRREERSVAYRAGEELLLRHPEWGTRLLRDLVLDTKRPVVKVLFEQPVLRQTALSDFLRALEVAATLESGMSVSGLLFHDFADLEPERTNELRTFVETAASIFENEIWIARALPDHLRDLARDVVTLAAILNDESTFARIFGAVLRSIGPRLDATRMNVVAAAPLVLWKGEVDEISPWLERTILRVSADVDPALHARLNAAIESRRFRDMPANPAIDSRQPFRTHARARKTIG